MTYIATQLGVDGILACAETREQCDWDGAPEPGTVWARCRELGISRAVYYVIMNGAPFSARTAAILKERFGDAAVEPKPKTR